MTSDLDVGMKCIKYMLFVSNFMFVMIGFLLISVGSTVSSINSDFSIFMKGYYCTPASLVVAIGIIIFFVALLGCIGAVKESTCLVNIYALCLAIVLILELSAAIAAYTMRNDLETQLEDNMKKAMDNYYTSEYAKNSWDFLQARLQCCGIHNYTEWTSSATNPGKIPDSCNIDENNIEQNFTPKGCLDKLSYIVSECALLLGSGALCVAFVQFLGIIFAHMLAKALRRVKTEMERTRQENRLRLYEQLARGRENKEPTPVLYTNEKIPL